MMILLPTKVNPTALHGPQAQALRPLLQIPPSGKQTGACLCKLKKSNEVDAACPTPELVGIVLSEAERFDEKRKDIGFDPVVKICPVDHFGERLWDPEVKRPVCALGLGLGVVTGSDAIV